MFFVNTQPALFLNNWGSFPIWGAWGGNNFLVFDGNWGNWGNWGGHGTWHR